MNYTSLSKEELQKMLAEQKEEFDKIVSKKFSVDIARGKPCNEQLDITMDMLKNFDLTTLPKSYRNYGMLEGIPEMRELFSQILGVAADEVIIGGSSSLNLMYDTIQRNMQFGTLGSKPWNSSPIKFLCPVPGYDRHFGILQLFGIEMINIPMDENGPIMDLVEQLVKSDESIKGIFCVPKYSNPTGITYSKEVVSRLAKMPTAAQDFRIFWDNAYCVHDLENQTDNLANIMDYAKQSDTQDRIYIFASTSKITFAGAGVSCMAASKANLKDILSHTTFQTIGYDKVSQFIHYSYIKNLANLKAIMDKQKAVIKPKFDTILNAFEQNFGADSDIASWIKPRGGYFITLFTMNGCAKRVFELCKQAGLTITPAGAPFPYGKEDDDKTLRIAPTFTTEADLEIATSILVCCVKLAALEKLTK